MRFNGTESYVATEDLTVAVNAAIVLERPLLVKGEPGTGKTVLAEEIARAVGAPLLTWHIKSTTKAQQGLYEYDAVSRLRDSQLGDPRVSDIRNYIKRGKLWDAFAADARPVLLIDEIDKADIEFPNDLLLEVDRMEFHVYETGELVKARQRPIVVITSNNEKELPDAFLRRCFFHYIKFPDAETMARIVEVHYPASSAGWSRRRCGCSSRCGTCRASRRSRPRPSFWIGSSCSSRRISAPSSCASATPAS
jgi:MoxR-like ATPase